MFDRTTRNYNTYSSGPRNVNVDQKVTVTENRAPTDEAVSLLKEMQEAAANSILCQDGVNLNGLKSKLSIKRGAFDTYYACITVDLNGETQITVEEPLNTYYIQNYDRDDRLANGVYFAKLVYMNLCKKLALKIASNIMGDYMKGLIHSLYPDACHNDETRLSCKSDGYHKYYVNGQTYNEELKRFKEGDWRGVLPIKDFGV